MPINLRKQMKAWEDKAQAKFSQDGTLQVEKPAKTVVTSVEGYLFCPFCLYRAKVSKFLVSTKKGISHSMAKCPSCNNGMRMRSLTMKSSIEGYAKWVFDYSLSGFWQKCPYKKWSERLKALGWSRRFWDEYKKLKGEFEPSESYDEYLERAQRKQAEEEGWI